MTKDLNIKSLKV